VTIKELHQAFEVREKLWNTVIILTGRWKSFAGSW
jgi:hypothetical protein